VGSRWDHGTDIVPGGNQVCNPSAVVESGMNGARYWCEIAARTSVQAAAALGWPVRAITGSRDGHTWEHAVAEIWSNQFGKWFLVDTDFNFVYEADGIPLSAFEITHDGPRLAAEGRLGVRRIGVDKPSLPLIDLLPFFDYIHLDLRDDWCTRPLRQGSPAGGDRATWWTSRPRLDHLFTAKVRQDDEQQFNWAVNAAMLNVARAVRVADGKVELELQPFGYSPFWRDFQLSLDGGGWQALGAGSTLALDAGPHVIGVRMTDGGGTTAGPPTEIQLTVAAVTTDGAQ
jgi:hypothetical protein